MRRAAVLGDFFFTTKASDSSSSYLQPSLFTCAQLPQLHCYSIHRSDYKCLSGKGTQDRNTEKYYDAILSGEIYPEKRELSIFWFRSGMLCSMTHCPRPTPSPFPPLVHPNTNPLDGLLLHICCIYVINRSAEVIIGINREGDVYITVLRCHTRRTYDGLAVGDSTQWATHGSVYEEKGSMRWELMGKLWRRWSQPKKGHALGCVPLRNRICI
ncbi:unnamed protein product [Thelazia callipaeda]|uniref:2OG-FeII_Oxy_2 domain-containing protein n=1 Tax=Thelazia callipaeda TaxID=103827 RepID=A0A0N5CUM0_THECL|nr:unnamed protein product [Thelazia callipaeda]